MNRRDARLNKLRESLGPKPDPSTARTFEEWQRLTDEWNAWMDAEEAIVTKDFEAHIEDYTVHIDSKGRQYGLNEDGSRDYYQIRTCSKCGARNNDRATEWWADHIAGHELHHLSPTAKHDAVLNDLLRYAGERHYGQAHVLRWNRALAALGVKTGESAMTLAEAEACYNRFSKKRWGPVLEAMREYING